MGNGCLPSADCRFYRARQRPFHFDPRPDSTHDPQPVANSELHSFNVCFRQSTGVCQGSSRSVHLIKIMSDPVPVSEQRLKMNPLGVNDFGVMGKST